MKTSTQKGFIVPLIGGIVALLIAGGIYWAWHNKGTNAPYAQNGVVVQNDAAASSTVVASSTSFTSYNGLRTYDNFGIFFQYPSVWGIPKESFYDKGFGSISFDYNSSDYQPFSVYIQQDVNLQGTELLNETLDQMITRFRANDEYIYQVQNISADGVEGRELFYNSAVTGQPYHVEAYFPFRNGSYVSLGANYKSVPQSTFDSVISTLKWDSSTAFKQDTATGMAVYKNNGVNFEYPLKLNTDYASLNVNTSVEKIDSTKLDNNGCYPNTGENSKPTGTSVLTINGLQFCYTTSGDVGAGQLYTDYTYTTFHNGYAYSITYSVHTSNGCGAYKDSTDLNSPENKKYNECLDSAKNSDTLVVKPIRQSISTFKFTN